MFWLGGYYPGWRSDHSEEVAMSWEPSKIGTNGARRRDASGTRREAARNSILRRITLESLEPRVLLDATLPTPTVVTSPINITGDEGNDSSPTIAVDPSNSEKLAAVWVRNDPKLAPGPTIFVEMSVSTDGGTSWSNPTDRIASFHRQSGHERPNRVVHAAGQPERRL